MADLTPDLRSRLSVVIPVFNAELFTRICLASLETEQGEAEVIVVDNGSTDGTQAYVTAWAASGPNRSYLRFEERLGFARACNAGAGASDRDFILFLNNDTYLMEGFLERLAAPFAEDPAVMVTGARLLYPSGHIQHAGVAFNELGPHHAWVGMPGDVPIALERRDYPGVTGAALAIRRSEFERQGGFDTSYQSSFEDVDLCLKVVRDGGRVVYVPDAVAYHFESMTEGRLGPSDMRNYDLFMERWGGRFKLDIDDLHREAVRRGIDLEDRIPSRREVLDRDQRLAEAEAELRELRRMSTMRPVRVALAVRNLYRRLIPRRAS